MKLTVAGQATGGRHDLAVRGDGTADSVLEMHLELPASGVIIDTRHDGQRCGELVHAELNEHTGALNCVAVLDNDWLLRFDGDTYFSPDLAMITRGRTGRAVIAERAGLLSLSITPLPAGIGLRPVTVLAGDLRDSTARYRWEMSWRGKHPLVARAVDALPTLGAEQHRARTVVDRRLERDAAMERWARGQPLHFSAPYAGVVRVGGRRPRFAG